MPTYLSPGVYVEEILRHPGSIDGVRTTAGAFVDAALSRNAAFLTLHDDGGAAVAGDAARIVAAILTATPRRGEAPQRGSIFVASVDFPAFVSALVNGVFDAMVSASVEQMEAYAGLIAAVAASVGDLAAERASEAEARDLLARLLLAAVAASATCGRG
jgi:hypothetical protein